MKRRGRNHLGSRGICDFSTACTVSHQGLTRARRRAIWASIVVGWIGVTECLTGGQLMSNGVGKLSHLIRPLHHHPVLFHATYDSSHYITFMGSPGLPEADSVAFQSTQPTVTPPAPTVKPTFWVWESSLKRLEKANKSRSGGRGAAWKHKRATVFLHF